MQGQGKGWGTVLESPRRKQNQSLSMCGNWSVDKERWRMRSMVAIDSKKWGFLWQASSSLSNQMLPYHRYYHQFTPSIDVTHRTQKYHRKPDLTLCTCIGRGLLTFKLILISYVKFPFWGVVAHSSFLTQDWGLWDSRTLFYKMKLLGLLLCLVTILQSECAQCHTWVHEEVVTTREWQG
jgi:hypothetical protein